MGYCALSRLTIYTGVESNNIFAKIREPEDGFSQSSPLCCRPEAEELLAIAETLSGDNEKLNAGLDQWRQQVHALLAEPVVEDLSVEARLEALAMELRRRWITLAQSVVVADMKSPPVDYLPMLPASGAVHYQYERVRGSQSLEDRLKALQPEVTGWEMEVTLFNTGMAAIATVITCLRAAKDKYQRAEGCPLQLDAFVGYFETLKLLRLLDSVELPCRGFQDYAPMLERFGAGETDILFLELIAYDWRQTVVDPNRLLAALESRSHARPWVLVVDSTLLGPGFQIEPLLVACGDKAPLIALEVRSGLKLDQVGLEFSNVGIVKTLTPTREDGSRYPSAQQFHSSLVEARKVLGNALSVVNSAILDAPWIFHPEHMVRHSRVVFDNNQRLAIFLSEIKGLFFRVNHPALSAQSALVWAQSPIVVMEFHDAEDEERNHEFLLAVINHEIRQRALVFYLGSSFGFRHHRCEIVVPEFGYRYADGRPRGYLKVAMGSRAGPSFNGVLELMKEIAGYSSFEALRLAYPQISPKRELARFPDLQSLRMIK